MFDLLSRRRLLLAAGAGLASASGPAMAAGPRRQGEATAVKPTGVARAHEMGLVADAADDQTAALQAAIDQAALKGVMLQLPPGRIRASAVALRERSHLAGQARSVLQATGANPLLSADRAHDVRLEGFRIEGGGIGAGGGAPPGVVTMRGARNVSLERLAISGAPGTGLYLERCSGSVRGCRIERIGAAGLWAMDSLGLEIVGNTIEACSDNGILVWRSEPGEDGTLVAQNRITQIAAVSGGSGQNGNGVNVFRAGRVRVTGNDIADCAYSAVRGNAASNIQIVANNVARIGEVALYAEFGFEGALIAQNIVDGAAAGISVTNFNEGGRLAVIQGNLLRNLRRREAEPVDKRGEGIAVEADAVVSGNTIEGAATAGIVIGWGRHMRNVNATANVIRDAGVGVMVTGDGAAGSCLVAQNLFANIRNGAVRLMDHGRPVGADLLSSPPHTTRIVVSGNVLADGRG